MWIIIFESCDLNLKSHNFKFDFLFKFKISVGQNDDIIAHCKKNLVSVKAMPPDQQKSKNY
jgi:hypothetical protein